ncbi:MAG TPA: polyprenyl synthetase family protein [Spirochaetia bacterium]|nr:polyprenyl synthetase family protein [Spirochaetia bacterium]
MDLGKVFSPVAREMAAVDVRLQALMREVGAQTAAARGKAGILERIVQHPFAVPGKRIRPALVLLTAHAVDTGAAGRIPDEESLVTLAGAVEILHAASLVHDDIIDNAESRRHQVSLNKRFGNRVAVLAGDILYTNFFSSLTGLTRLGPETRFALLDIFLETTKAMCMGEIIAQEVAASGRPLGVPEYIEIATDKTAVLFAACCRGAAVLCGAPRDQQKCLGDLGLAFGLAFQMADDLVDKDHGLDRDVDLAEMTRSWAQKARDGIAELAAGSHRDSLRDLVEYVISSAIP